MLDISELSCINCHEAFNTTDRTPRLLAECGHTLCTSCISSLLAKSSSGFECPDDGTICGASKKTAEEFPKNLSLLRILEKQEPKMAKAQDLCAIHKMKTEVVCVDCKMRICSKCALFGGHRTHDLRTEEDVQNEIMARKECLQEMLQMVAENEQIFARQDELKMAYEKCIAREQEIHTLIKEKFQEYFKALEEKKTRTLQTLENIMLTVKEKFKGLRDAPEDLHGRVDNWKLEANDKCSSGDEANAFDLLENKQETSKDILNVGGELLEQLAQLKSDLSMVDVAEILDKWTATFDKKFKNAISSCCVISNPFDVDCNLPITEPDENGEEILPVELDDGNLLNESVNLCEGDYLLSLSPGKRPSLAQPAVEFNKRESSKFPQDQPVYFK